MNSKSFALQVLDWHGGQRSALYSIGSSLLANRQEVLEDLDLLGKALLELEKDAKTNKSARYVYTVLAWHKNLLQ